MNNPKQKIIAFIREFSKKHGHPPSVAEITEGLGYRTTSATQYHIEGLVADGKLSRQPRKARTLVVIDES